MQNLSSDSKPCIPPNTMSLEDSVEKDFPQSPSHTTREKDMEDSHEHETDVYRGLSPSSDNNKVTDGSHDKVFFSHVYIPLLIIKFVNSLKCNWLCISMGEWFSYSVFYGIHYQLLGY